MYFSAGLVLILFVMLAWIREFKLEEKVSSKRRDQAVELWEKKWNGKAVKRNRFRLFFLLRFSRWLELAVWKKFIHTFKYENNQITFFCCKLFFSKNTWNFLRNNQKIILLDIFAYLLFYGTLQLNTVKASNRWL